MIQLLKGDCLELMKYIPDGSIDAIITDPPYGTTACKWDSVIPFDLMWEQLNRIIKPKGAIVLFGSEPFSSALRMSNIKNYKYDWVWDKKLAGNGVLAKIQPLKIHELIHIFSSKGKSIYLPQKTKGKLRKKMFNGVGTTTILNTLSKCKETYNDEYYPKTILEFSMAGQRKGRLHPTQKPVELMEYLIKTYTNELETVLDFTMGSGTTGVACVNTKRKFIGIEQDDKYFEIAKERINKS
jgi:DNA modification methylase